MYIDSCNIKTHTRLVNPNSGQWLPPGRERQEQKQEQRNRKETQGLQLHLWCFVFKFNNNINRPQRPVAKSVNLIELVAGI